MNDDRRLALELLKVTAATLRSDSFDYWPTAALKLALRDLLQIGERMSDELDERGGL